MCHCQKGLELGSITRNKGLRKHSIQVEIWTRELEEFPLLVIPMSSVTRLKIWRKWHQGRSDRGTNLIGKERPSFLGPSLSLSFHRGVTEVGQQKQSLFTRGKGGELLKDRWRRRRRFCLHSIPPPSVPPSLSDPLINHASNA